MAKKAAPKGFQRGVLLFLLALALGALFLFIPVLAQRLTAFGDILSRALGLGTYLILPALVGLLWLWRRRRRLLWQWWYRWVGVLLLSLAGLGALSLAGEPGGRMGELVPGPSPGVGVARVVVLAYLGFLLIAPGLTLPATRGLGRAFWWLFNAILQGLEKVGMAVVGWRKGPRPAPPPVPPSETPAGELKKPEAKAPPESRHELQKLAKELGQQNGQAKAVITPSGWELPLLETLEPAREGEWGQLDTQERARRLEEALVSYGVEAKVAQINVGPTVTQFGVEPGWDRKFKEVKERDKEGNIRTKRVEVSRTRVKVERIQSLSNDLALALAAPSIRIEAPVPGKPLVGIEVPNTAASIVTLRSVVDSTAFQRLRAKARLALALGKGTGGEAVVGDLAKMPHLLIAGATGSGKTVFLNSLICSFLLYNTPEELRLLLIDPKRVELVDYNGLPHLTAPVVVEREKAVEALVWLDAEMDARYRRLAAAGVRNIEEFNKSHHPNLPYLVLVVDELADIMLLAFEEVERRLCRLAQLARATGIHLMVATQRPSVDVVTGLIKANFPSRISFALASQVDSRTILDMAGAEKLLGRGDMLFLPTEAAKPKRLQGCFVSPEEVKGLVAFWSRQRKEEPSAPWQTPQGKTAEDPLLEAARRLAREYKQVSASFLQRRLQIGYTRAVKLLETLEGEGLVKGGGGKE